METVDGGITIYLKGCKYFALEEPKSGEESNSELWG